MIYHKTNPQYRKMCQIKVIKVKVTSPQARELLESQEYIKCFVVKVAEINKPLLTQKFVNFSLLTSLRICTKVKTLMILCGYVRHQQKCKREVPSVERKA